MNILLLTAMTLLALHFGIPIMYYIYAKTRWLKKEWGIGIDASYMPRISVIVPTYNEAENIEKKLNNLLEQGYPLELMEIIIADDHSTDNTTDRVENWHRKNPNIYVKIIKNKERLGKIRNVFNALKYASGDIVVITDADTLLEKNSILNAIKYFADPVVGVVTASLREESAELKDKDIESTYKVFYNVIRIAESKIHSTPIHNGALQAFRKSLLKRVPLHPDAEDCMIASFIAFSGYRAIQVDDVWAWDPIRRGYFKTKVRRARHNIAAFIHAKKLAKKAGVYRPTSFEKTWKIEWYLYIINPWLLLLSTALLIVALTQGFIISGFLLILGLILLVSKTFRTWILQQIFLIVAMLRSLQSIETM
jgi:cellulose synthase/poly-beta-1,6-N-acetylglucosamine synthase-like glycosyltransferase